MGHWTSFLFHNLFADSAQLSGYLLHFYQILGNCQYYLDKWGEAKGNYQEALMLTNGKNDLKEKRAILLTQIGNTTNKLGNLEEAIEIYKENLELHQEIFGEDDLDTEEDIDVSEFSWSLLATDSQPNHQVQI